MRGLLKPALWFHTEDPTSDQIESLQKRGLALYHQIETKNLAIDYFNGNIDFRDAVSKLWQKGMVSGAAHIIAYIDLMLKDAIDAFKWGPIVKLYNNSEWVCTQTNSNYPIIIRPDALTNYSMDMPLKTVFWLCKEEPTPDQNAELKRLGWRIEDMDTDCGVRMSKGDYNHSHIYVTMVNASHNIIIIDMVPPYLNCILGLILHRQEYFKPVELWTPWKADRPANSEDLVRPSNEFVRIL